RIGEPADDAPGLGVPRWPGERPDAVADDATRAARRGPGRCVGGAPLDPRQRMAGAARLRNPPRRLAGSGETRRVPDAGTRAEERRRQVHLVRRVREDLPRAGPERPVVGELVGGLLAPDASREPEARP